MAVPEGNGARTIPVLIEQSSTLGPYWARIVSPPVVVVPGGDQFVFADDLGSNWRIARSSGVDTTRHASPSVFSGTAAWPLVVTSASWSAVLASEEPVVLAGYRGLRLAVKAGDGALTRLTVTIGSNLPLVLYPAAPGLPAFDPLDASWQVLQIPVELLGTAPSTSSITIGGRGQGTLYLDDIRLVAATVPAGTAVLGHETGAMPPGCALGQNYPNPFNSSTAMRFELPTAAAVDLAVYDLTGQRVATLLSVHRGAGVYTVAWDGRDDQGKAVASGVYLYRLTAGPQVQARRLVLVR